MKYNLNFETILILCFISLIIYCLFRHFKHMENFTIQKQELNKKINQEMNKQLNKLKDISEVSQFKISNYVPHYDIYNKYVSDTGKILDSQVDTVQKHSDQKTLDLKQLDDTIKSLQDYAQVDFLKRENTKKIGVIKSHNNGNELSIELTNDVKDNPFAKRNYLVKMNNGCLKVEGNNNYNVVACNKEDKDQIFNVEHVYNDTGYKNKLDPAFSRLDNLDAVYYPFSLVKAKSNGNCLKQVHGKVSVEPCREYEGQRWASLKKNKSC